MKSVCNLLAIFLTIALLNACAFGMARNRCDSPAQLPIRPVAELCISNSNGSGGCFDPRRIPSSYTRPIVDYVCTNANDYTAQEEWIKQVMVMCK